ncbi:MAG: sugar phosphate isomerase/epimerase [Bacteroidetes bacterium]|nr:sugar phosphate isomerase/epimerase [Bacteroidota bacterium]
MHLAIHNWMKVEPIEVTVERLAKYGYKGLEIQGEPYKYDTGKVRKLLDDYGVRCWGSVTLMLDERNLLAKDEDQRAKSVTYVKDCVTMVGELGGEVISVVPSTVGKIVPDSTPETEWDWCVAALREINEHGRQCGVKVGIEPINRFETYFINRGAQALALAEAVAPDCGVCLDIFHMNIEEDDPIAAIHEARDRLVNFHVADNNRMACGMGCLDWPAIVQALKEVGYDGAISVEFCPPLDRTPANRFPGSVDSNPEGISDSERKFLEDHGSSVFSADFYDMHVRRSAETLLPLI